MLGYPLQWQILKNIDVSPKAFDEYILRKFVRGNHVEDYIVSQMDGIVDKQKFVEYRDCIGYIDVVIDHKDYEAKVCVIPHEIKSVSNYKYKRISSNTQADPQHQLQAGFYALGLNTAHYAIDYVASDDYRIYTMIYELNGVKKDIDDIIDEYNAQIKKGIVPVFKPRYDWQKNPQYSNYPEFMELDEKQIEEKLKKDYPESYKLLKNK